MLNSFRHLRRPTNSFKSLNLFLSKIDWISDAIDGVSTTMGVGLATEGAGTGTMVVTTVGAPAAAGAFTEFFEELDALILFLLSIP